MPESKGKKRIILPKKLPQASGTILIPSIDQLLTDALAIMGNEMARMRSKSNKPTGSLGPQDAKILQGYIKSIVELSKESRERDRGDDLSDMEDGELIQTFLLDMSPESLQDLFRKTMRQKELATSEPAEEIIENE